jgi:hypothetical protein
MFSKSGTIGSFGTAVTKYAQYAHHSQQHGGENVFAGPGEWCELFVVSSCSMK